MLEAKKLCLFPRCPETAVKGAYCIAHARQNRSERPNAKLYGAPWIRLCQMLDSMNPFCQRVNDGVRCRNAGHVHHHIIDANARPDLFYRWENVACVCAECHPRPNSEDQGEYVPTLYHEPLSGEAVPDIVIAPGARVPHGFKLWSQVERLAFFGPRKITI